MTTVVITPVEKHDDLYCHYQGEPTPQGCLVKLDLRDGRLTADYNPMIGNGRPESEYHSVVQVWSVPLMTAATANDLLGRLAVHAQVLLDNMETEYNANANLCGVVTGDADAVEAAQRAIDDACGNGSEDYDTTSALAAELIDAATWFSTLGPDLDAEATDEQVEAYAKAEAATAAEGDAPAGVIVDVDSFVAFVRDYRDQLREQAVLA